MVLTRRDVLKMLPPAVAGVLAARYLPETVLGLTYTAPIDPNLNPLEGYPNRDWEQVYRDLYSYDSSYIFLCAPNDTHGCLLRACVKNGVVKYIDPTFGYGQATDLYGNRTSSRWDPRICPNGHTYLRRFYSDRRVKGAFIRSGFKDWVDAGMPREADGLPTRAYFESRGKDSWESVPWDEAFGIIARVLEGVARTYTGPSGAALLGAQGYDPAMIAAMGLAGVQALKFRSSMAWLSTLRFTGLYRLANHLALLDAHVRNVGPDQAKGARYWDSYAWHTDLPPGHPMVTGNKTSDFDLFAAEYANLITLWGMNWIATKMPEGHWISEARLRGARIVTIATEYQSSSNKADEAIVIRPATDAAFALGLAHVLIRDGLYDRPFVERFTDLPLLVRMDSLKLLRMKDLDAGHVPATLTNYTQVLAPGESPPADYAHQDRQYIPKALRDAWDDFVAWDANTGGPVMITRDEVGARLPATVAPVLDMAGVPYEVVLADGTRVAVRSVFDLVREYLEANFTPAQASEITWAPVEAIEGLAREVAANKTKTLFTVGMGPNHYWNNDLKDRAIFLVAALTANEGHYGGDVGSYAGNYRIEVFNGVSQWQAEDPFNHVLAPSQPAAVRSYYGTESAHFYNYGDRPLRVGGVLFTGSTHMPTPTKTTWWVNGNSILGNAKWAYDVIQNTIPKIEMIVVNEWFWTKTCEYADVVLGVPSWIERQLPDIYGACTNPFLQACVPSPLPPLYDTRDDLETFVGVGEKLADLTAAQGFPLAENFREAWAFRTPDGKLDLKAYGQRVINETNALKGYSWDEILESCRNGVPKLVMNRTTPRITGWEQTNEDKPWYTKTGRLEFYREESEWLDAGENLPVFRETVDSTPYEPSVIHAAPHAAVRPKGPADYGLDPADLSPETRQVRNIARPWSEVKVSAHPLVAQGFQFVMYTPKYRHACHSMASSMDLSMVYFGPFGDFYRRDRRMPYVGEGYVDINPLDAKPLGIEDGDYIWVDGDPSDRPFRGWESKADDYRVMRWKVRARYYPNMPVGTVRAWFHMFGATHGSVEGHETRPDGLAKSPRTGYQAAYRYGSHQSVTRAWLKPTLMTDSLVRKDGAGQRIGTGWALDVHGPTGAPKESFVKISKAEDGGIGGVGLWHPASKGFRPTYEDPIMTRYLNGYYGGP